MWRRAGGAGALLAASLLAGVAGAAVAAAAAQVSLSPAAGGAGSPFTVTGSGFPAGDVEIHWDNQTGPLLATATGPAFSTPVFVPDDAVPNSHPVMAVVRNGNAVSTSTAAYQVTGAPVETTTTAPATPTTSAPEPTTVAPATTSPPRSSPAASGLTGGVSTPAGASSSAATPSVAASSTPPSVLADPAPAVSAAPSVGSPPGPTTPVPQAPTTGSPPSTHAAALALGPRPTSQSSAAVRSPALLVTGLGMALAGAACLAVRSRRRSGPSHDLPFSS